MFAKPGINPIPRYLLKITTTQPYKKQIEIIQSKLTCKITIQIMDFGFIILFFLK